MNNKNKHWLYEAATRRKLWIAGIFILVLTVIAEAFIDLHVHFDFTGQFSFHAIFGFLSCVMMIVFAKLLGYLIKRRDDYYDS